MDPMVRVRDSTRLDNKTKRSLELKIKSVNKTIQKIELMAGITYPPFYVAPVLTISRSTVTSGTLGVLYARTIPVQTPQGISIVVEVSAPLVLYATIVTMRIVLAHELLHYVALVKSFSQVDLTTQITSASIFEERYSDSARAINPRLIFEDKRFASLLARKTSAGLDDPKLDEKCKVRWIEKGMPVTEIPIGSNQVSLAVETILRSKFDPKVKEIISRIA